MSGLSAQAEVLNIDGLLKRKEAVLLDSAVDSVVTCMRMQYPEELTPTHFVQLTLSQGGTPISTNLYLRGAQEGNFRAIRQLPKARLRASTDTRAPATSGI